ncbi:hypothetical protein LH51_09030 [Nitrincola sp. A-D6]|uniref:PilZ domain-containing protein n=1 Tax=Nitrincola sp. A-D6 TaxID=1545442 RepID=UPI00051FD628|nr:PilZ domain-containing protein [Nitrincola sp. A-D6]KGK42198.1 hypothetical protein LH51_09030 [Nitrincola sp. A-D6]
MEQDRRQFYRIDRWVALEFQLLETDTQLQDYPLPGTFRVSPHFMLHAELQHLNLAIDQHLARLEGVPEKLVQLFQLLNQKTDIIAQSLTANDEIGFNIRTDLVNLSEGGLSFNHPNALNIGQKAVVRLIMPESETGLRLMTEVKRCETDQDDNSYEIGLEFLRMPEACRMELARLILRSQIDLHKAQPDEQVND